jgi:ribosome-associated protein
MENFILKGDFIELSQLLKASGLCDTGGMAKTVIQDGQVEVDGVVERRKACKIRAGQIIVFNDQEISVIQ